MKHYRLYEMCFTGDHIEDLINIEATDDVEAICQSASLPRKARYELWHEAKFVWRFDVHSKPVVGSESRQALPPRFNHQAILAL